MYRLHLYIVHNHIISFAKKRKNASFKRHIFLEVMLFHTSYLHSICLNTSYKLTKKPFVFIFSVYGETEIYTKKGQNLHFSSANIFQNSKPHTPGFSVAQRQKTSATRSKKPFRDTTCISGDKCPMYKSYILSSYGLPVFVLQLRVKSVNSNGQAVYSYIIVSAEQNIQRLYCF